MYLGEARKLFDLKEVKSDFWKEIRQEAVPAYLIENIERIQAITSSDTSDENEEFSRTIMDQILTSAFYEENYAKEQITKSPETIDSTESLRETTEDEEDHVLLQLHHETQIQRKVTYQGEPRLLSGFADYTIWYDSSGKSNLATNLIIIEAKKPGDTDR